MKELIRVLKYSLEFYLTLAIPMLYLFILYVIKISTHTMYFKFPFLAIGLPLTFFGLVIWVLSYVHLGKSFGVLPKRQPRVERGVYKYIPHPMYVGISMSFIGLSLLFESSAGFLLSCVVLVPLLIVRAVVEERKLKIRTQQKD